LKVRLALACVGPAMHTLKLPGTSTWRHRLTSYDPSKYPTFSASPVHHIQRIALLDISLHMPDAMS